MYDENLENFVYIIVLNAGYDGHIIDDQHPAFISRKDAEHYVSKLPSISDSEYNIFRLKLKSNFQNIKRGS